MHLDFPSSQFTRFPEQGTIALSALRLLATDERVMGLYLSGSFADGTPDIYSDIDIYILVPEHDREAIIRDHERLIDSVATVATKFPATHLGDRNQIIVFYEARFPIHVDYQYRTPPELVPRAKDRRVALVLDRVGLLGKWQEACQHVAESVTVGVDDLQYLEDRFWGWCWYTHSKIQRGEIWEARDAEEYIRSKVLVRLVYFLLRLFDEGNRRLEMKLPPHLLALLESTIPHDHTKDSYRSAMLKLIDAYVKLFDEISVEYGIRGIRKADRSYIIQAIREGT